MTVSTAEKKQHRTGITIAVVGSTLAMMTQLIEALGKLAVVTDDSVKAWKSLGMWVAPPLGLLLLVFALYIRFSKSSRLLLVEALQIDPDNPAHLIGHSDKIDQLQQVCQNGFLVNLVGESGAGKGALVRSGLVPTLEEF